MDAIAKEKHLWSNIFTSVPLSEHAENAPANAAGLERGRVERKLSTNLHAFAKREF